LALPFYRDFTLGILGGGQLGRMLMQPCIDLNVSTAVLDPAANAPCSSLATRFQQGSLQDFDTLMAFGRSVDLLTIEIENVNVDALYALQAEGKHVYPQPELLAIIKDKRLQKNWYRENKIPTADFVLVDNLEEIREKKTFLPAFNKVGVGGYDGGGVVRLNSTADIDKGFDAPGLLEKTIDFACELSVIVARSTIGEIKSFPAVECVFHPEHHLVDYLLCPARVSKEIENLAQDLARKVCEKLGIVGVLAVEMFVTKSGEVLVNEIAPRPHNSGHQTIEANVSSQYSQHLRAILGLPLGETTMNQASAMVNLIGAVGHSGPVLYQGLDEVLALSDVHVHLYGKSETRPARKMGHVTVLADSQEVLLGKVKLIKQLLSVEAI
jgi:5-(carboxyamino)imidazole ribonucleotide synthase